jgi:hypothetical protein
MIQQLISKKHPLMKIKLIQTMSSVLLLGMTVNAQNLLVNGSFESLSLNSSDATAIAGSQFNYGWDGTTEFTPNGWTGTFGTDTADGLPPGTPQWITVASGNPTSFSWPGAESIAIDPSTPLGPLAEDGSIYLRLDTTAMLSQTVNTVIGQAYDLSFWVGANGDMPSAPNSLTGTVVAYVNGSSLGTFTETANFGDELDWKQYTETFTATNTSTTISFSGATDVSLDEYQHNGLDSVSLTPDVTAVPEPNALTLAGLASLSGCFFLRRRK